ncbi:hypothetical protein [Streptomyces sp. NPDC048436]|uniref:hypothetical protein n=1 Tax=Streptomyces sp. NPDC048436 TaxID=3365550 RepID=UPI00371EDE6B
MSRTVRALVTGAAAVAVAGAVAPGAQAAEPDPTQKLKSAATGVLGTAQQTGLQTITQGELAPPIGS